MKFKVAIDAGHGGNGSTPGKRTPDGEYEWNFNDKVVRAVIEELNNYEDVEIKRVDDASGKTDVPLKTRTHEANAWGADIYISVHHNANTGKWGNHTGTETFTYIGSDPKSEKLASIVHPLLVQAMGLRDRGLKKANFHVLRETKMPAILVECGYMDSLIDIKKLRDDKVLKLAGQKIAEGIAIYAGLKKKQTTESTEKTTTKNKVTTKVEKVQAVQTGDIIHGVEKDDTLWKIAQKYGVGVEKIKSLNGLKSDTTINCQKLIIKKAPRKMVVVTVDKLWTYNKPDWNAKEKVVNKGEKFTITQELVVEGHKMYKLASGLYITANPKYVKTVTE